MRLLVANNTHVPEIPVVGHGSGASGDRGGDSQIVMTIRHVVSQENITLTGGNFMFGTAQTQPACWARRGSLLLAAAVPAYADTNVARDRFIISAAKQPTDIQEDRRA